MSQVDITVGSARVVLDSAMDIVNRAEEGSTKTSIHFEFDDLLHAVARAAGAALGSDDAAFVQSRVSRIREHLADSHV